MYIVSVIDGGKERTFKATAVMMADDEVFFISKDVHYRVLPHELIGVIHISYRRSMVSVGQDDLFEEFISDA